jgi:hypothetical protein
MYIGDLSASMKKSIATKKPVASAPAAPQGGYGLKAQYFKGIPNTVLYAGLAVLGYVVYTQMKKSGGTTEAPPAGV